MNNFISLMRLGLQKLHAHPALFVFLAALLIRSCVALTFSRGAGEIENDALEYHRYALSLLAGEGYVDEHGDRAARMPGYPLLLAIVYYFFGQSVSAVQIVQVLLGALFSLLLFLTARDLLPRPWPIVAAGISLIYLDGLVGTPRLLTETVSIFLLSAFLFFWIRGVRKGELHLLGAGIAGGMAILIRPEAVLYVSGSIPFLWNRSLSVFFKRAMLVALPVAFLWGGWIVRNVVVLDAFIPTTSRAGFSAYWGIAVSQYRANLIPEVPPLARLHESEVENDRLFAEKTKEFYQDLPFRETALILLYNAAVLFYPFRPGFDPTLLFFLPFLAYGIWGSIRNRWPEWPLISFVFLSLAASYVIFGSTVARYREPLAPATILLVTLGITHLFASVSQKTFKAFVIPWAAANIVLWIFQSVARDLALWFRDTIW